MGTVFLLCLVFGAADAQGVEVDISACQGVYNLFQAMQTTQDRAALERQLDSLLATRAYTTMFSHYNRPFRPNTLPKDVFRRMVLSLKYPEAYQQGENFITDDMRTSFWKPAFDNLPLFKERLGELQAVRLQPLIDRGIAVAQSWLPPGMNVPDFYFVVLPVGRSNAFVINGAQAYDFFQLDRDAQGKLLVQELVGNISHESHHLGMKIPIPQGLSSTDSVAFYYLRMFIPEGMANKFVDNLPGGATPVVDPSRGYTMTPELDSLWQRYTAQEKEMFQRLTSEFEQAANGQLGMAGLEKLIRDYWLQSATKPPLYFMGTELLGAIYHGLGKEAVFQAVKDPRSLFTLYNKALKKNRKFRKSLPFIPKHLAQRAYKLGRE
ncbi:MAG: DUF5700 domain-containing putative Zn-dependent protease [Rufibacter sp.]